MIAMKFITFVLGTLLLLPFAWSFAQMVLLDKQIKKEALERLEEHSAKNEKEFRERREKLKAEAHVDLEFDDDRPTMFVAYATEKRVYVHPRFYFIWAMASRPWVGVCGLAATFVLLCCLYISSFHPVYLDLVTMRKEADQEKFLEANSSDAGSSSNNSDRAKPPGQ